MDLSIIIPVYNTKKQDLLRCCDSVRSFADITYEVILVDDGSEMETAQVCRQYAELHPEFRYIHQNNQGVSAARNRGLRQALGRYVMFVDADDEVFSKSLHKEDLQTDAHIIFYDFELIEAEHSRNWNLFSRKAAAYLPKKEVFAAACHNRLNSAWSKLYRRDFLENCGLLFDQTMVFAEDAKFVFQAITAADSTYYACRTLYRYHHDFKGGDRRLRRFPEKVIGNSRMLYDLRSAALDTPGIQVLFNQQEYLQLTVAVQGRVIQDFFELAGSLLIVGQYSENLNQMIQPLAEELYVRYSGKFSAITEIKCFLLAKEWNLAIWLAACLREIYIRIRR